MHKKILLVGLLAVLSLVIFFSVAKYMKKSEQLKKVVYVSGVIEATEVNLAFRVGGKIKHIFVDEGVFVKASELLASLDKTEFKLKEKQAKAAYKEALLSYGKLKRDFTRAKNLYSVGAITKQEKDSIETSFKIAKAKLEKLRAFLELSQLRLNYTDLRAPEDGFIIVKARQEGEMVNPGSVVFTLLDLKNTWLTAYISETDLGKVKLGQKVDVTIDTYPNKKYHGRVSFISQKAEFTPKYIQTKEERTKLVYRIKITLNNSSLELKPGMPADAYIHLD